MTARLLRFEFYKFIRQKSFYICTVILMALAVLSMVSVKIVESSGIIPSFSVAPVVALLSNVNDTFIMLAGIFVALLVCGDFSQQTVKNIYGRGFSKTQVFFAKFGVAVFGTFIMFVLNYAVSFILGLALFGEIELTGVIIYDIVAQFAVSLAYVSFAFMLSFAFRKTGVAIALTIVGPIIVNLVLSLVSVIAKTEFSLTNYWISGILTKLSGASAELSELSESMGSFGLTTGDINLCLIISLAYTAVFIAIGYYINKRKDG